MLPARGHGLVEMMRYRIESLVDRAMKLSLSSGEQVAHAFDAYRSLRLQSCELDQLFVGCFRIVPAQRAHGDHDQGGQQRESCQDDHDRGSEGSKVLHHVRTL